MHEDQDALRGRVIEAIGEAFAVTRAQAQDGWLICELRAPALAEAEDIALWRASWRGRGHQHEAGDEGAYAQHAEDQERPESKAQHAFDSGNRLQEPASA